MKKPHTLIVMERRNRLLAEGMCVSCGKRPAVAGPRGGRERCSECREANTRQVQAARQKRERKAPPGTCRMCLDRPATIGPRGGEAFCDTCRDRGATYDHKRRGKAS
jgi:hypothetical protein